MAKKVTWYAYDATSHPRRYLGHVKAENGRRALEISHAKWGDLQLDVIRKKYVADRELGTMRGPQKKSTT